MRGLHTGARSLPRHGLIVVGSALLLALAACQSSVTITAPSASPTQAASSSAPSPSSDSNTYSDNGVSFQYPADWKDVTSQVSFGSQAQSSNQAWAVDLGLGVTDLVDVTAYGNTGITPSNLTQHIADVTSQIKNLFDTGTDVKGPTVVTMGGLKGLQFDVSSTLSDGTAYTSTLVLVFSSDTEYFLNCQATSAHADEIAAGCSQIQDTFTIG